MDYGQVHRIFKTVKWHGDNGLKSVLTRFCRAVCVPSFPKIKSPALRGTIHFSYDIS
jgi:hypothetical protein